MSTVANLYRDIGMEIGDPDNANIPHWQLLIWINKAIKDIVNKTKCLWKKLELTGQQKITIKDYSNLSGDIVTIVVDDGDDETTSTLTEGVDWTAATSNAATAASLETAIEAVTGLTSYVDLSDTAVVWVLATGIYQLASTITCDASTDYFTIGDAGYVWFNLEEIDSTFREMRNVYDTDENSRLFRPVSRQQWDRLSVQDNYSGFDFTVVNESGVWKLYVKANGGNFDSTYNFVMEYYYKPTVLTAATDSPPGLVDDHDEAIIRYVVREYHRKMGNFNEAAVARGEYILELRDIRRLLREQGEPQETNQFTQWY